MSNIDTTTIATSKKSDFLVFAIFFSIIIIVNAILLGSGHLKWGLEGVGIMMGAAFTISLYSFLYKDNPLFKMAEHFYVGVATAYLIIVTWYSVILTDVIYAFRDLTKAPFSSSVFWQMVAIILPTLIGLLVYTRIIPRFAWMSKITFSIIIGFGSGLAIPNLINAYILEQAKPSMTALWTSAGGFEWNAIIVFIGVISTLIYFFFSLEHKGAVGATAKVGIWFLMVSFGASFGFTVMARFSLLIERVNFLFHDWIPLIK
ncbi:MAG: hypothetical protein HQK50_09170 [Oligoflexia bacterium]|nr:hypothetical protein [Oligoflexia bacterium]MBF0365730.1 hypothetical protein [Oligoflexia bacterium]